MDCEAATRFMSGLVKSIQELCESNVKFRDGVELVGHLYLNVDSGSTKESSVDYILKENVCRNKKKETIFVSKSYASQAQALQDESLPGHKRRQLYPNNSGTKGYTIKHAKPVAIAVKRKFRDNENTYLQPRVKFPNQASTPYSSRSKTASAQPAPEASELEGIEGVSNQGPDNGDDVHFDFSIIKQEPSASSDEQPLSSIQKNISSSHTQAQQSVFPFATDSCQDFPEVRQGQVDLTQKLVPIQVPEGHVDLTKQQQAPQQQLGQPENENSSQAEVAMVVKEEPVTGDLIKSNTDAHISPQPPLIESSTEGKTLVKIYSSSASSTILTLEPKKAKSHISLQHIPKSHKSSAIAAASKQIKKLKKKSIVTSHRKMCKDFANNQIKKLEEPSPRQYLTTEKTPRRLSRAESREKSKLYYEKIAVAIEEVLRGNSTYKMARKYKIPKTTLLSHVKRVKEGKERTRDGIGYSYTTFSEKQELQLILQCNQLASFGYFYGSSEVIDLAQNMARIENATKRLPSMAWYYKYFKKRHPDFSLKKQTKKEQPTYTENLDKKIFYFNELEKAMDEIRVKDIAQNIWMLNETEVFLEDGNSSFQILNTKKDKINFVETEQSPSVTLINAISAVGETLPAYFLFKGQRASAELCANTPEATVFKGDEKGWTNSLVLKDFLIKHFMFHNPRRPVLLLYDGNSTHIPYSLIEDAKQEGIHLFVLPPNSGSIFIGFKKQLFANIEQWMATYPMEVLRKEDLPGIMCSTLTSALTIDVVVSAFQKLGIFPFAPEVHLNN